MALTQHVQCVSDMHLSEKPTHSFDITRTKGRAYEPQPHIRIKNMSTLRMAAIVRRIRMIGVVGTVAYALVQMISCDPQ